MLTILLTAYILMHVIPLLYIAATMYSKRYHAKRTAARRQYQDHISNLAEQLFPPSDTEYREAKRKMVENIKQYFDRHKMDALMTEPTREVKQDQTTIHLYVRSLSSP